jgi:hypothetical protein
MESVDNENMDGPLVKPKKSKQPEQPLTKPKKEMTEAKRLAFEKMAEKRRQNIELRKQQKKIEASKILLEYESKKQQAIQKEEPVNQVKLGEPLEPAKTEKTAKGKKQPQVIIQDDSSDDDSSSDSDNEPQVIYIKKNKKKKKQPKKQIIIQDDSSSEEESEEEEIKPPAKPFKSHQNKKSAAVKVHKPEPTTNKPKSTPPTNYFCD